MNVLAGLSFVQERPVANPVKKPFLGETLLCAGQNHQSFQSGKQDVISQLGCGKQPAWLWEPKGLATCAHITLVQSVVHVLFATMCEVPERILLQRGAPLRNVL